MKNLQFRLLRISNSDSRSLRAPSDAQKAAPSLCCAQNSHNHAIRCPVKHTQGLQMFPGTEHKNNMRKVLRFMECLHLGTKHDRQARRVPTESADEDACAQRSGWHQSCDCVAQKDMKAPMMSPFGVCRKVIAVPPKSYLTYVHTLIE
jgi:hypothetical protein